MNFNFTKQKFLVITRCSSFVLMMLLTSGLLAQTNGPCANNNNDFPPSIDPAADYMFDASSGSLPDLCLDSDGGCVRVTFTNIPTPPPGACPAEISAFIGQGCGGATGNICLFEVTGFEIGAAGGTVSFCAGTSETYSFIACRPGNGPLSFNNISVGVPSVAIDSTEICVQDIVAGVDLTALIPDGTPLDGSWTDTAGNPIASPTAAPITGKPGDCVDFIYNVAEISQCTGEMCNKVAVAQVCIECCGADFICPVDNSLDAYGCNDLANIPACPADVAALAATPYNVIIGAPCGVWILDSCTDNITNYDVCAVGGQTITRTVSVFDDINCNGILDGAEAIVGCDFVFTITEDTTPPTVSGCPMPLSISCSDPDPAAAITAWVNSAIGAITAASSDDCGAITVISDYAGQIPPLSCSVSDPGTLVTFTVADNCGNEATCSASAIILNDVIPSITCPADQLNIACISDYVSGTPDVTIGCSADPNLEISDLILVSGLDGCDGALYERTYSITDNCDRTASCTQQVTLANAAPTITCPAGGVIECADLAIAGVPTVTTSCQLGFNIITDGPVITGTPNCDGATYTFTHTVIDACERTATCEQTYTISNASPTITCPPSQTVECISFDNLNTPPTFTTSCDLDATLFPGDPIITGTLNCPGYSITYPYTVEDECGRTASCSFTCTIENDAPTIDCSQLPTTVDCESTGPGGTAIFTVSCGQTPNYVVSDPVVNGIEGCPGTTYTYTHTVTDECGRSASCEQIVTTTSTLNLVCPNPPLGTYSCGANLVDLTLGSPDAAPFQSVAGATANGVVIEGYCGSPDDLTVTVVDDLAPDFCAPADYTITRTITVTDPCGNSEQCIRTYIINVNDAPTITCPADYVAECADDVISGTATATLDCDEIPNIMTTGPTLISGNVGCDGAVYETVYSVTDQCGKIASCTQTITIQNAAPTITCPADFTADCFEDVIAGMPTITASCSETLDASISDPILVSGTPECNGAVYNITYSVTDACNRTASCTQTINIANEGPSLACPPDIQIACTESTDPANTGTAVPSTSCNLGVESLTYEDNSSQGTSGCDQYEYVISRLWTIVDDCGQSAQCTQTITVVDQELPVINCPADVELSCTDDTSIAANGTATATDNCSNSDELTITSSDVSTQTTSGCGQYNYTIIRTWSVVDVCGNVGATCDQIITVSDTEGPTITCPADATVSCDADNSTDATGFATAVDNCADTDSEVTVTLDSETSTQTESGCGQYNYVITRTFIAQDVCGNFSEPCVQTINVVDEEGPAITCPEDAIFSCDEDNSPTAAGSATATDNCSSDAEITITWADDLSNAMGCNNTGFIVRTWTATDICGNTTSCTQTIEIFDDEAPVITVGATSITVQCDGNGNQAQYQQWLADNASSITGTDNCGTPTLEFDSTPNFSPICGIAGYYIVSFNLVDDCGNFATTIGSFTVEDNNAPTFDAVPADITIDCCDQPNFGTPSASDLCNGVVLTSTDETNMDGDCPNEFSITRTWIAYDDCGNASLPVSQTIYLEDNTPPVIEANNAQLIGLESGDTLVLDCTNTEIFSAQDFFIGDCCDPNASIMMMDDILIDEGCTEEGVRMRMYCIWIGKDACGNTTEFELYLDYVDTTAPHFTSFPDDVTVSCSDSNDDYGTPTGTDDCHHLVLITSDDTQTTECVDGGIHLIRTWTIEDECGNIFSQDQLITLLDNEAPVFSNVPNDTSIECGSTPVFGEPSVADACGTVTNVSSSDTPSVDGCNGIITRTWTATDNCGNTSSVSSTITVVDDQDPVFANVPADINISCENTAVFGEPTVSDNCDADLDLSHTDATSTDGCSTIQTRTWTATDNCGNSASASQSIIATDDEAPVISNIPATIEIECGNGTIWDTPTATDNCGNTTLSSNDESLFEGCATGFAIQRTWTATDDCGNTSTITQTAHFIDNVAPYFTYVPEDINAGCDHADFGVATATDDCDNELTLTQEDTETTTGCSSTKTRTWTVTDDCGNSATASQTITTSNDDQAPVINNVGNDLHLACGESAEFSHPTVSDDCFETTLTSSDETTSSGCSTTTTRTWTATDACGNTATASQSITTTNDNEAPVLGNIASDFVDQCNQEPAWETPTVSDNCGDVTLTFEDTNNGGSCESGYDITRIWTATDACGNTSTISQTVWVYPTNAESTIAFLYIPPNQTIGCNDEMIFGNPIPTSSCEDYDMTFEDEMNEEDCGNRSVTRTWTATNDCEGVATCQQTINVVDNTPPYFTYVPENTEIGCDQTVTFGTPTCEDECSHISNVTWEDDIVQTCGSSYSITRTWTIQDACGNTNSSSQRIDVNDTEAPVLAALENKTVGCDDTFEFDTPTATESCGGNFELSFEDEVSNNDCAVNYAVTRTWTAVDECGNIANTSQTITRPADLEAPSFNNLPENQEVACGSDASFNMVDAIDNCSNAEVTFVEQLIEGNCEGSYRIERTWTATDNCGNTTSATRSINFSDNTPPVFVSTPAGYVIDCNTTPTFGSPVVADNCGQVELSFNDETSTGDCASGYTVTRIWTAIDACGNEVSASQTITVSQETTIAFSNIPSNQTISCNDELTFETPEVASNCNESVELDFTEEFIDGTCATSYSVVRTWTATACGVEISASSTITVEDNEIPTFNQLPENKTISCSEDLLFDTPSFSDNCSEVTLTYSDATDNSTCEISTTRTWIITDACGNMATAAQTIIMLDETAPTIQPFTSISTFNCSDEISIETPTALDNCNNVSLNFSDEITDGVCAGSYSIARTWTATDACGNMASTIQQIEVSDDEAPILLSTPENYTVTCGENLTFGTPTFDDNCGVLEVTFEDQNSIGDCTTGYDVTRTWYISDGCGNIITTSQTISIVADEDAVLSFVSVPMDQTIQCGMELTFEIPTATSTCGELIITHEDLLLEGTCGSNYSMTRTWTIEDSCENELTTSQTIYVVDEEAPTLAPFTTITTVTCEAEIPMDTPAAFDNCSNVTVTHSDQITNGVCASNYNITRTWTATDECGNTASTVQQIQVSDDVAPTLLSSPADFVIACNEEPVFGTPTYNDNCGTADMSFDDNYSVGDCNTGYTITRTWTIIDACGNEITTQQKITVMANSSTSLVFDNNPSDLTVTCGSELNFETPLAITDPNCGEATTTFEDLMVEGSCASTYAVTRTWTASDECQNVAVVSQTIFVEDTSAPIFTSTPENKVLNCIDQLAFDEMEATDDCGNIGVEFTDEVIADPNCPNAFVQIRTWTATDDCGNTTAATQMITVEDNSIPYFTSIPLNKVITCDENITFDEIEAIDECGDVTITYVDTNESSDLCSGLDKTTRTWTVSDGCGNVNSVLQSITIVDDKAPEFISDVSDKFLQCNDPAEIDIPQVLDDCSNVTIQYLDTTIEDDDNCTNAMSFIRTWMATDECGNMATKEQFIYVEDTEAPVFENVDEIFLTEQEWSNWRLPEVSVIDNCSAVTISGPAEDIETGCREMTYTYTWFASDNCGNRSEMTTKVHVEKNAGDDCLLISPNPITDGDLKVIFEAAIDGNSKVKVYDLLGRTVYNVIHEVTEGQNKIFLNLNHLSASTYVITVEADKRLYSRKFVKILN